MASTPEIRWLLACVRSLDGREAPPPPGPLSWDDLLAVAQDEGLAPALGFAIKAKAPRGVPLVVRERSSRKLADSIAQQLLLGRELARLLRRFEREGMPVIPLKGPALAETLYPHPALRPSSDLDLLIRPEALAVVDGLLQTLGYHRLADAHSWDFDLAYDRATLYAGPDGVHVDLHWGLLSDPRYAWNEREGLAVWDRAVKIRVAGEEALGLCPEDLLLYLATHLAVHHGLGGLLWYWDLTLLLERWGSRLDWEAVIARASRWRVRTALAFALAGCDTFFGVSAPAWVTEKLGARGPRAAALRWLLRHPHADRLARLEHLIALLLVDRGRDILRPLIGTLFPSPAWVRARYAGAGSSLPRRYLAHYRRLAAVVLRVKTGLAPARLASHARREGR